MAENIKINNVSPTKNCNICRCLMLGAHDFERCQNCLDAYGKFGVPDSNAENKIKTKQKDLDMITIEKRVQMLETERKSSLLITDAYFYKDQLDKVVSNFLGIDIADVKNMSFVDKEFIAKLCYDNYGQSIANNFYLICGIFAILFIAKIIIGFSFGIYAIMSLLSLFLIIVVNLTAGINIRSIKNKKMKLKFFMIVVCDVGADDKGRGFIANYKRFH